MTNGTAPGIPRISVALCTFNGARFLQEQLASLLTQTRLPNEVVVCDDGSSDGTMSILEQFARRASFPVQIHRNPENLGSNVNFDRAMRLCTGSLIAFCDQDDIWLPKRLQQGAARLESDARVGLIFSNGYLIDDAGQRLPGLLWDSFHFGAPVRESIRRGDMLPLMRYRFVTGATVMMRAWLLEHVCPAPGEWVHDGWLAALTACMAGVDFVDEPLIEYRRHANQQVGTGPGQQQRGLANLAREHWLGADWHRGAIEQVLTCADRVPPSLRGAAYQDFFRQHEFLTMRLKLPAQKRRRWQYMAPFRADYARRASGWKSMAFDMLLPKQSDETGSAAASGFSALHPGTSRLPARQ
jgi:glycosyltransferase involved in cell wall biosynthesis